jgi:hypothetical protein
MFNSFSCSSVVPFKPVSQVCTNLRFHLLSQRGKACSQVLTSVHLPQSISTHPSSHPPIVISSYFNKNQFIFYFKYAISVHSYQLASQISLDVSHHRFVMGTTKKKKVLPVKRSCYLNFLMCIGSTLI